MTVTCAYCGRPTIYSVWINGQSYHEECAHGPEWRPPFFGAVGVTEEVLRRVVREELERAAAAEQEGQKR